MRILSCFDHKNNKFLLKHNILLIFLLSTLISNLAFAQPNLGQYINKSLPCLDKKLTIHVHWVNDSLHVDSTKTPGLTEAIKNLNLGFEPICMSFEVCKINFINLYEFDTLILEDEYIELDKRNHQDFRLNLYIVSELKFSECGFTDFYSMKNEYGPGIVITKACLRNNGLPHYVGRSLGLLDTYETEYGLELVNGSNCETTGDKICDTPADPKYPPKPGCALKNILKDPNGDIYLPDISNFMSGYFGCQCKFSYEQYKLLTSHYHALIKKPW